MLTLAIAALVLLIGPNIWVSKISEWSNILLSGHHILLGRTGLTDIYSNMIVDRHGTTISLDPQLLMIIAMGLLAGAIVLTLFRKKSFLPIIPIIFSMALTFLAVDHFEWLAGVRYESMHSGWVPGFGEAEFRWGFNLYIILMLISIALTFVKAGLARLNVQSGEFKSHLAMMTMLLPGTIFMIIFAYLPMPGILIAFKNLRTFGNNAFQNFFMSEWVGLNNFRFMFATPDAWLMTRNTVLYNLVFIALGLIVSVAIAIGITELSNRRTAKLYQTLYFLPFFLSWVVVSYITHTLLAFDAGVINNILRTWGMQPIEFYMERKYWPFILIFVNIWRYAGHGSIIYMATIVGMDNEMFEAAAIDGANRAKQIWHITIPNLKPIMILLTILAMGRMFAADFGLFYLVTRTAGALRQIILVIDVYVFSGLTSGIVSMGMTAAAALYQSIVGFMLILLANYIVKKISPENTLL